MSIQNLKPIIFARIFFLLFATLIPVAFSATSSDVEFFSVKTEQTAVRESPSKKATALWTLWKYAPVIAVSYRGNWMRARDFEGDEGWITRADLAPSPTVCTKGKDATVRQAPSASAKVVWILDRGYGLILLRERGAWYEVSDLDEVSGWIKKSDVWGAPLPKVKL